MEISFIKSDLNANYNYNFNFINGNKTLALTYNFNHKLIINQNKNNLNYRCEITPEFIINFNTLYLKENGDVVFYLNNNEVAELKNIKLRGV